MKNALCPRLRLISPANIKRCITALANADKLPAWTVTGAYKRRLLCKISSGTGSRSLTETGKGLGEAGLVFDCAQL